MTPLNVIHTGPMTVTQEQSDLIWEVLSGNPAVVSLLRGADPIHGAHNDTPALRAPLVTRECQPPNGESAVSLLGRNHGVALPSVTGRCS